MRRNGTLNEAFSELFDRAVAACAEAQRLSGLSAEAVARARATRASARRVRALVWETRDAWAVADLVYSDMRGEVQRVALALREAGLDQSATAAAIRAHIRFVLYDGGLAERDAEPVVDRANSWVNVVFRAA